MPTISVIMPCYHEKEVWLRQAIESILTQTYQDFEYIIVQDDPTNRLHTEILQEYAAKDQRIQILVNEKNTGIVGSLNRALSVVTGDYIAQMDADDISLPDRLESQLSFLQKEKLDLVGGLTRLINEDGDEEYLVSSIPTTVEKVRRNARYNNCVPHSAWLGRKSVFEKLNGYRDLPYCEDYDFLLRTIASGFRVSNIPKCVLQYRISVDSVSRTHLFQQYLNSQAVYRSVMKGQALEPLLKEAESKFTENQSRKYSRCYWCFNTALNAIQAHQWADAFCNLWRAFWGSRYFARKMVGLLVASI